MKKRLRIVIRGAVQGVGFRPFVYRLAIELKLTGWVVNSSEGVFIEVEGPSENLDDFLSGLEREKPPRAFFQSFEVTHLDAVGYHDFEIRQSASDGALTAVIMPDLASCPECLAEVFDPSNRRYLYPFTNCTNCGPRFSIIESLPYDRPNTTMKLFAMCEMCSMEYTNPVDRRFHAQPNACPQCGPHVEAWDPAGKSLASSHEAIQVAAEAIRAGRIVAVKGMGGFHLVVDARIDEAVVRLRERKRREEKPFALMFPSFETIEEECSVTALEARLLRSPESPIVLLKRRSSRERRHSMLAPSVAPGNPYLGIMLPYTPLHHIMLRELRFPVVATSGNLSDEPICIDEQEALDRLGKIADLFLVHDRKIKRHVDDSVARVLNERELVLRRARGYAPLPLSLTLEIEEPVLAVGAHLKNAIAITSGNNVFISQHIGDLETQEAYHAFEQVISDLSSIYRSEPRIIISDAHPSYLSTQYAIRYGPTVQKVQHHYAHVASCMAENQLDGRVLGVSWDGTGFGYDETIWGGEFLLTDDDSFERVATFRRFKLPGGEQAIREPRRSALGVLYEILGAELSYGSELIPVQSCSRQERKAFCRMMEGNINSPRTSSVGRLFDAVSSIVGLRQRVRFEGQAAMELEFAIDDLQTDRFYGFRIDRSDTSEPRFIVDWGQMIAEILDGVERSVPIAEIAAAFHNTLAEVVVQIAGYVGEPRVVLTGGCFQNRYLAERTVTLLTSAGFRPYWHQRVPPNDGGIALGQIYAYARSHRHRTQFGAVMRKTESAIQ